MIATPIGNLGDVSQRALDTLRGADRIVAEDTRRTRQLLTHFGIVGKRVERLDAHARERDLARIATCLSAGERVALVTDAGTPGVSDPGQALVETAIRHAATVVPIPGPSAVVAALVASGLANGGRFRFLGFLPRVGSARRAAIATICDTPEAVVLFESPRRTRATLLDLAQHTPSRIACIARELTKLHEEFVRGTVHDLASDLRVWKGEITIVLGANSEAGAVARSGKLASEAVEANEATEAIESEIDSALARGERSRAIAARLAAQSGLPKRVLYARIIARTAK